MELSKEVSYRVETRIGAYWERGAEVYLHIALQLIRCKVFGSNGKVGVDGLPVPMELLVAYVRELIEVE